MDLDYPLWLDYGADNYAGVTWSNVPGNRTLFIGWMNNWNSAGDVPCAPWRSAMTLPRELSLRDINGSPVLVAPIVAELDGIAGEWQLLTDKMKDGSAYEAKMKANLSKNSTIRLENTFGEYVDIEIRPSTKAIVVKRSSSSGRIDFNSLFALPSIQAPINCDAGEMDMRIVVDASSMEIICGDGAVSLTNLVFPKEPYNMIRGVDNVEYRTLKSIW